MVTRKLGKSGLQVSEIGLGCWAIGGPSFSDDGMPNGWAGNDDNESIKGLHKAYETGINHWDTADTYGKGHSERLIGKVFREGVKRSDIILATKVGWFKGTAAHSFEPLHIQNQLEQSLKNLNTDYVDIFYFHNPYFGEDEYYLEAAAETVYKMKQDGKLRYVGQSAYTYQDFIRVSKITKPDVLQFPFNAMRSPFDKPETDIFKWAEENNLGMVIFGSYAKGILLGKYDPANPPQFEKGDIRNNVELFQKDFLEKIGPVLNKLKQRFGEETLNLAAAANQYVLARSKNAVPIPGFKNDTQVEMNAKTSEKPFSDEDFDYMNEIFKSFKNAD